MKITVTDEQVADLTATAKSYSVTVLHWGPQRHQDGAETIELEHQRRMMSLRANGVIAVLCPVLSDTTSGIAIMTVPAEQAAELVAADPCVKAGMMTYETHACLGFPGDALPA